MTNPMLAELDEVVPKFGRRYSEDDVRDCAKRMKFYDHQIAASILTEYADRMPAHADMAKRLEAAERDAAYGRALQSAMEAEYQAAKTSRKGGKQAEWVTTYRLLRRVKVAADHLTAIDATQEGEG